MIKILIAAMLSASVAQASSGSSYTKQDLKDLHELMHRLPGYRRAIMDKMDPECMQHFHIIYPTDGCLYHYAELAFPTANEASKKALCDLDTVDYTGFNQSETCKQWRSNQ